MVRHLRSIMRLTWMDKVTNKEILERIVLPSMEDLHIRKNLRWTGHIMRMSPERLSKQVLYSQLSSDHRKRGRPRLWFKDIIKRNLKLRDIKTDPRTSLSQQVNAEQQSSNESSLCRITTDSMMDEYMSNKHSTLVVSRKMLRVKTTESNQLCSIRS
ncbi:hypothetical protein NP493_1558g00043 [Ridgeia piscesae]|uniref:Uncharacterized protein n=1 Tax=Ridgeia piscesae TaxID=27915 RepID=A0AAD9N9A6_RIDPI|nr:hypothetical protein NP493_1558g00043 [Ridgeia piscesae]